MTLHFTATESTFSYFEATRKYIEAYGKPVALYSDKASVFSCNSHSSTPGKGVTQYGRALYGLNIDTWCANSSQAKGRVERANLTLQDRLVKELRLRGIDTKEAANAYAPPFIADFNGRFGKVPRGAFDAHRPLRDDEDLNLILSSRVARRVTKVIEVNEPLKAALEEWLTWMRPNLLDAWENYQFLRYQMFPAYEKAGLPEDEIFELVVCAAFGESSRQLNSALAALDAVSVPRERDQS